MVTKVPFALPDISTPVIDRKTGFIDGEWYRFFEIFSSFMEKVSGATTANGMSVAEMLVRLATAEAANSSFRLRFEDYDNLELIAADGLAGGGILSDAPLTFGLAGIAAGKVLANLTGGAAVPVAVNFTFLNLTDTPANYTGQALKSIRVNAGETGLEFF